MRPLLSRRSVLGPSVPVLAVLAVPLAGLVAPPPAAAAAPPLAVAGAPLGGATVPASSTVSVSVPGAVSAKFVVDGHYLGSDMAAPLQWRLDLLAGSHVLRVRTVDARGTTATTEATFRVAGPAPVPAPVPYPAPSPVVRTTDALRTALATARPGTVITLADGEYASSGLTASASGTPGAPITLRGSRAAVLRGAGPSSGYGLHVTGSSWRIEGITVAYAGKGIVLDRSVGTVLSGVEVHDTGAEGVHFRACSSDGVLRGSTVRSTGLVQPQYGEGVYVGSASSNWGSYGCEAGRDGTHRVLVEGNVFRDVPGEGADLKEGTVGGVLRGNVFDHVGWSGANSADSAIDAKGNGWLIEGNRVSGAAGSFLDGFQTHSVVAGWGTGNTFRANTVAGAVRGYGFALTPVLGNTVDCSNSAPGAVRGLSSVPCRPAPGTPRVVVPARVAVLTRPGAAPAS